MARAGVPNNDAINIATGRAARRNRKKSPSVSPFRAASLAMRRGRRQFIYSHLCRFRGLRRLPALTCRPGPPRFEYPSEAVRARISMVNDAGGRTVLRHISHRENDLADVLARFHARV